MLQRSFLHGLFACVFAFSNLTTSPAIADDEREYVVKVSLIQKIVGFVNPISKQAKIEVCVLGDNRLISLADAIHKKDQKISLVKETKLNNVSSHCNVLFIGTAEAEEYKDAIDVLKNKPVLTIGDSSDFIESGGMVMLSTQNKIRFVINKGAMGRAGLSPDPELLDLAAKVVDD